jgi:hypothetical protein
MWPWPEIRFVLIPFRAIALTAQRLQVSQLSLPAAGPRNNVIDIDWPFLRGNSTQRAAPSGGFQNQKTKTVRNRLFIEETVIPYADAPFLHEGLKALLAEHPDVSLLLE